mmetsp:Transcript_53991/g.157609  ORF Transcript_53991/g.157609 Transcript_53991/m.157609 type:complete len:238 (+) Transcript_53991:1582-2295(+)
MPRPAGQHGHLDRPPPAGQQSAMFREVSPSFTTRLSAKTRTSQQWFSISHQSASPSFPFSPVSLDWPETITLHPGSMLTLKSPARGQIQPMSSMVSLSNMSQRSATKTRSSSATATQAGQVGWISMRISFCRHSRQRRWPSGQAMVMPSPPENWQTAHSSEILEKLSCTGVKAWLFCRTAALLSSLLADEPLILSRFSFSLLTTSMSSAHAVIAQRPEDSFTMSIACFHSCVKKAQK